MMNDNIHSNSILIVEDEPELAKLLGEYLAAAGFQSLVIANGIEADTWLQNHTPLLVLLDIMLPGRDGMEICKNFRKRSQVPVIMVTAKVEEIDRLLGLELGADDYICKPYSPREVVARVKAVLRRYELNQSDAPPSNPVILDEHSHGVTLNGQTITLTSIEFRLLKILHDNPGRIFSRQYLMDHIYTDYRVVSDRTVDSHIKKMRKKLQVAYPDAEIIRSVYGAGYKFELI